MEKKKLRAATMRWEILRRALLPSHSSSSQQDDSFQTRLKSISRKGVGGFNLVPCHHANNCLSKDFFESPDNKNIDPSRDVYVYYELPSAGVSKIVMIQRTEDFIDLDDFAVSSTYDIDTTGLVCCWPSEDVLAYYCMKHSSMFRFKKVLELGSGYGLAGLAIAAKTDANEVVISDGNPQVVEYIQRNISLNADSFGNSEVKSMMLHWNQNQATDILNTFDIIVASDCTFFKKFHVDLAHTIKSLLKYSGSSEAIFFSPKRGDSLDKFVFLLEGFGLKYELSENYDEVVWNLHSKFLNGNDKSWPNYDRDHNYPLLLRITHNSSILE